MFFLGRPLESATLSGSEVSLGTTIETTGARIRSCSYTVIDSYSETD